MSSQGIVAFPSSGATRHLLPDGEKDTESALITSVPLPVGERVDCAQRETGEGLVGTEPAEGI